MNWDQLEGKWTQLKGIAKKKWGKLTDDDLDYIAGSRDRFIGRLQERYGMAKEEAQKQADEWLAAHPQTEPRLDPSKARTSGGGA
ncbi:MAG: CsbD family protein [Candidatus Solibacter sp.]|nr:CsbD family protein [Candidatus Solibacter sp.]